MDRAGNITRKLSRAVLKDTVVVPDGGYTIVRFYADNPGNLAISNKVSFLTRILS